MRTILTSFNAGELSPKLGGRVDIDRYEIGCKTLQNFIVHPHGGATRRSGFEYIATAKYSTKASRLIPFEFNVDQAYILEIGEASDGDGYIRFYMDGGQIESLGSPYELKGSADNIPWDDTELFEISISQSADTMYFAHPNWAPRKLTRADHDDWTMTIITFSADIDPPDNLELDGTGSALNYRYAVTAVKEGTYEESIPIHKEYTIGNIDLSTAYVYVSMCGPIDTSETWTITSNTGADPAVLSTVDADDFSVGDVVYCVTGDNAGRVSQVTAVVSGVSISVDNTYQGIVVDASSSTWQKAEALTDYLIAAESRVTFEDIEGTTELNGIEAIAYTLDKSWTRLYDPVDTGWLSSSDFSAYTGGGTAKNSYNIKGGIRLVNQNLVDTLDSTNCIKLMWDPVDGASHYNIYRSEMGTPGFLAQSKVPSYIDTGKYEPDTDDTPPQYQNPFDGADDYPSCVCFYEERLMFASTNNSPQTIWGSQTANYENMNVSYPLKDDDAVEYTLSADQVNIIRSMFSGKRLFILTTGGEWWMDGGSSNQPITPTSVQVKRESTRGSEYIQPIGVGDSVIFVERGGKTVRDFSLSESYDGYDAKDLMIFSDHLTESYDIIDIAYQQTPDSIIWCARSDGILLGCTFVKEHKVLAWHRHVTDGEVESVAIIPGDNYHELWAIIKRTIDGTDYRYIERLSQTFSDTDTEDAKFVDSWLSYNDPLDIEGITKANPAVVTITGHGYSNGDKVYISDVVGMTEINDDDYLVANKTDDTFELTDTDGNDIDSSAYTAYSSGGTSEKYVGTLSGLDHLEGETVQVLGDGAVCEAEAAVSSGSITISNGITVKKAYVGLQYTSNLETMALEVDSVGTIHGLKMRISKIVLRLYKTILGECGPDEDNLDDIPWSSSLTYGEPLSLFTGDIPTLFEGPNTLSGHIYIRQDLPLPMSILAILPELEA